MQFQVPQFIETEDKIVGPFTIRQFIYVAAAGGVVFLLYFMVQTWLFAILAVLVLGLGGGLAFVKIGERPLIHVALAALNFYWSPQTYVWQPEQPKLPKTEETLKPLEAGGISLERIVSGAALRNIWQNLQTGTKMSNQQFFGKARERYQIFQRPSGEMEAARRIDYR